MSLPVDPATGEPLPPRAQPGYYPGFHVLSQQAFWDEATREVVLRRVGEVPPIHFFREDEALARAVFDRILPQDDRDPGTRIPVLNYVDETLASGRQDGYQYEGMPSEREIMRLALRGIEGMAQAEHGRPFTDLDAAGQERILLALRDGQPATPAEVWQRIPPLRAWESLVSHAADAYYAHPYAWDEIGFGGPSYPRGYMRIREGRPEPWEVQERRYAWEPPPESVSGEYRPLAGLYTERATPRMSGTH